MGAVITTTRTDSRTYVNDWTPAGNNKLVNRYGIIGTDVIAYAVWEPFKSDHNGHKYTRTHSTITHHAGACLGDITTREIPAEIDSLPYGEERIHAVRAWHAANEEEARAIVKEVYPQDFE